MAEKLCELRKKGGGGGKYTETSLWTNQSPTSDFAGQSVTLSQSMDDFKYIKIVSAYNKNNLTYTGIEIIPVEELKKAPYPTSTYNVGYFIGSNSTSYNYARRVYYINNTSMQISSANLVTSGTGGTGNQMAIPLEILGLNELDHGKRFDETTLWTNSAPTSSFAQQEVTLSDNIDNYDFIKVNFRNSTSDITEIGTLISASDVAKSSVYLAFEAIVSSAAYARRIQKTSSNSVTITGCYKLNAQATLNTACIPTSIVGCKFK